MCPAYRYTNSAQNCCNRFRMCCLLICTTIVTYVFRFKILDHILVDYSISSPIFKSVFVNIIV
jgi:hypothetical protein